MAYRATHEAVKSVVPNETTLPVTEGLSPTEQIQEILSKATSSEQSSVVEAAAEGSETRVAGEVLMSQWGARAVEIQAEGLPAKASWTLSAPRPPAPSVRLQNYRELVSRAVEVFGDELKASTWLSRPSTDLNGRTPLDVAQSVDYDESRLQRAFEPIFTRIEHGIYR